MMRTRIVVIVGSALLVVTLTALSAVGLWCVQEIADHTRRVDTAVSGLTAYQDVQRALAAEAFAEAGYRRAPSTASRARLETAAAALGGAADRVRQLESRRDLGITTYLLAINERYRDEVRQALREGTSPAGVSADDRVAGPALDAMQHLVDSAVSARQRDADVALRAQQALNGRLAFVAALSLLLAACLVGLCWTVIVRQHRALAGRAADHEHRAEHDPLTGLGNRVLLERRLDDSLALPSPDAALLLIDLDGFKLVNDTFGHLAGDALLIEVGRRIREAVREDDLAVRLGGDEFAVVCGAAAGAELAARLKRRITVPLVHGDHVLAVGASIGMAVAAACTDRASLMATADEMLYDAKRARRTTPAVSLLPAPRVAAAMPPHSA